MSKQKEDAIYIKRIIDPAERVLAWKSIKDSRMVHVGGDFRQEVRLRNVMGMLALDMDNETIKKELAEFDAAQAELDEKQGKEAGVTLFDMGLPGLDESESNSSPPDKYAPCPCGSGRKYKFCCYKTSVTR